MSIIIRNRTIRPSTRAKNSAYRIRVENAQKEDRIIIFIDHESKDFRKIYKCTGVLFQDSDSIYFMAEEEGERITINWRGKIIPQEIIGKTL